MGTHNYISLFIDNFWVDMCAVLGLIYSIYNLVWMYKKMLFFLFIINWINSAKLLTVFVLIYYIFYVWFAYVCKYFYCEIALWMHLCGYKYWKCLCGFFVYWILNWTKIMFACFYYYFLFYNNLYTHIHFFFIISIVFFFVFKYLQFYL